MYIVNVHRLKKEFQITLLNHQKKIQITIKVETITIFSDLGIASVPENVKEQDTILALFCRKFFYQIYKINCT